METVNVEVNIEPNYLDVLEYSGYSIHDAIYSLKHNDRLSDDPEIKEIICQLEYLLKRLTAYETRHDPTILGQF